MSIFSNKTFFSIIVIFCRIIEVCSRGPVYTPPNVERLTDRFGRVTVNKSYDVFFGGSNIQVMNNGTSVDLNLDKSSGKMTQNKWLVLILYEIVSKSYFLLCFVGSGLVSKNKYYYGFFNAALKLPSGFTSGVVVAYYVSFHINQIQNSHSSLSHVYFTCLKYYCGLYFSYRTLMSSPTTMMR